MGTYECLLQKTGSGTASSTHAQEALCEDADGALQVFPINEPVWKRARCVLDGAAGTDVDAAYADNGSGTLLTDQPYLHSREAVYNYMGKKIEANWAANDITQTSNAIAAPTGEVVAAKFMNNNTGYAYKDSLTITVNDFGNHTYSCFVKAGNSDWTFLKVYKTSGDVSSYFQLTGADSPLTDQYGKVYIGDGWWRVWVRFSILDSEIPYFRVFIVDDTGVANTLSTGWYVYAWGVQVTHGDYIKPLYLPPTTVAAGSDAFINTWDVANHNNTAGGYYFELDYNPFIQEPQEFLKINGVGILFSEMQGTGSNLITYPTSSTTGWTAFNATISSVTFDGETGCLAVADNGSWSMAKQAFTAVIGTAYVITCMVHTNDLTVGTFGIYSNGVIATSYHGDVYGKGVGVSTSWQEITFGFVATSTALVLGLHSASTNTVYYKDIIIKERDTDLIVFSDGTNQISTAITEGEHQIGIAWETDTSEMDLCLDGTWYGSSDAYDGSFGTGDLSTEATIRELQGITGDLTTSKAAIDVLMP